MEAKVLKKMEDFFGGFKKQTFNKGEILIRADEEPTGVFYLKEGVVRQYAISQSGEDLTINIFKAVSFFPMSWAINNTFSPYYFEAMTKVVVWKAPKKAVLKFISSENDVLLDLLSRIYQGLDGFYSRMEYLMSGSAKSKLITDLLIFAKRFGEVSNGQTVVRFSFTEKDLASLSGIARETVSRELIKLEKKGIVEFKKKTLIIHDLSKLKEELQEL